MARRLLVLVCTLGVLASACSGGADDSGSSVQAFAAVPPPVVADPTEVEPPPETPTPDATATPPTPQPTATLAPTPAPTVEIHDAPGDLELPLPIDDTAQPGTIIDTEEIAFPNGIGERILYHSTSAQGDVVAVSGFVAYPDGEVPEGGWPLIAWAHGTVGLGDSCAPSLEAENDQLAQALVSFGYAVVATDYEGLGTPGTHPYIVGASEAHSVLDSVRAVQQLDLPVTDQWIVFGHSQGGHAAMFTGQLQRGYAPELDLIGVVAGAPPSQMVELNEVLIGGDFQGYLVMTAAGLAAGDDDLVLSDVLSPAALDLLDVIETGCTAEIFEVFNPLDYDDVTIVDDPFSLPEWAEAVTENDTNRLPIEVPLLIIHGGADEQLPVETSATLLTQLCSLETQGPTARNVYEGQTHAGVLTTFAAVPDLLAWVGDRFAGGEAPDDCTR